MEFYNIEQTVVEQKRMWADVRTFVEETAVGMQLHEAEKELFKMMLKMGRSLLEELIARNGTGKKGDAITEEDGKEYKYQGIRPKRYLSVFGEIQIRRAYYWSKGEEGRYPIDEILNLPQRQHSYLLQQWLMADIAETTYDRAIERFEEMLGIKLWKHEQALEVMEAASRTQEYYKQKGAPPAETEGEVICATADCKGVRMVASQKPEKAKKSADTPAARLGKGMKTGLRKDAVVTCDYTFNPEARTARDMADILMRKQTPEYRQQEMEEKERRKELGLPPPRTPLNKQHSATMYGKETAFAALAERIKQRDPQEQKSIYILVDGEQALERGLLAEFRKRGWKRRIAGICLDIFHVMEYLWEASTALHGEKSSAREPWVHKQTLALLEGGAGRIAGGLRQIITKTGYRLTASQKRSLNKVITYFDNHRHMMQYDEYLAAGFPIGTGLIEGACGSLVKERMDGSGKRWTKKGAQAILDLRAIKQNLDWNDYMRFHIRCQHEKLYGKVA